MSNIKRKIKDVKEYINLPFVFNHWYVAGLVEEFDQTLREKTLLERSVVFYRTENGDLNALQNRCLHRSFPLSKGYIEDDLIVCRYHGIRYASDGTIARVPCQATCPSKKLHKYPLAEIGPFVFIWMGEEGQETSPPELPFLDDPGYRTVYRSTMMQGNYLFMQDNLNDLTHFAYLHKDTFSFGDDFFDLPTEITEREDGSIFCNRVDTSPAAIGALPPEIQERVAGQPVERHDGGYSTSPGVFEGYAPIYVGDPEGEREVFKQHIMHYVTPETRSTTHYFWSISNDFALENDMFYQMFEKHIETGFNEDCWAVEHMQVLLDNDGFDSQEISIAGDRAALLFRGRMLNWILDEYEEEQIA